MINISIIIPVFNEDKNILKTLLRIQKNVKNTHEILVVYDTESDTTIPVVNNFIKSTKIANVRLVKNDSGNKKGVMNAIKSGFKHAKGITITVTMADLSDDVTQIDNMFGLIEVGNDIVSASRYMPKGEKIGGPVFKTLLSRLAGLSLHYIVKIPTHDATNAFKMYRKNIFKKIKIESTGGFEYSMEIIVKAFKLGYKIIEIPTVWKDREEGKSNFKLLSWLPNYIKWYLYAFKK